MFFKEVTSKHYIWCLTLSKKNTLDEISGKRKVYKTREKQQLFSKEH